MPVLVEVKRAVDTRLRREVVGQMLDYAANGVAYWRPGEIADEFAASCAKANVSADDELQAFLGDGDPTSFWDQVDSTYEAGRIKLVFVADEIPADLARIVEFLNGQMKADVRSKLAGTRAKARSPRSCRGSSAKPNWPRRRSGRGRRQIRSRSTSGSLGIAPKGEKAIE